ncbi:regulator of ribonuclease activity A [Chiayiivirga flava]|uniref:4-hydroxy-4-methyl-2-oxoglutarate aldolase n=1 Tax=Chiayiivirga flava TaxID=659595 RepID=A0A7W8D447_9GAMM|nr:regulator of ribonuclease activity A [Chiayiivirga flava]
MIALPWRDLGGRMAFSGTVSTVRAFEDNSRVREAVAEPGHGRVLLVAGGGSLRRAMLGDLLAAKAVENGWEGIVIDGVIRDSGVIAGLALGVKALGVCPRKTEKLGDGRRDVVVEIGGVAIAPGQWLCADADGVVVMDRQPGAALQP